MRYSLLTLGAVLIAWGLSQREWGYMGVWLGVNLVVLGVAHWRGIHGVFGKRADGTLPLWSWGLFFPLHIFTGGVWHLMRIVIREPASSRVNDWLVIGRRLLPAELLEPFDCYVDLTAEFEEPSVIRSQAGYRAFPILDGAAPSPEALRDMIASLPLGTIYVHCAQGHGRTGLFAVAFLLHRKEVTTLEGGLSMLQSVRPGVDLNRAQWECLRMFLERRLQDL